VAGSDLEDAKAELAKSGAAKVIALECATGEPLWESRLASSVEGFPVSFEIDGVQYVGIPTGRGGGSPWRIGSFLTPELVSPGGHNALYVFKLGGL